MENKCQKDLVSSLPRVYGRACIRKLSFINVLSFFLSSSSPVWFSSFVFKCVCYYYTPFVFLFFVFLLQLWLLFVAEIIITQPNQKHCPTFCRAQTRKRAETTTNSTYRRHMCVPIVEERIRIY